MIEDAIRLREQPVVLRIDANTDPEKTTEVKKALCNGWYDAAKLYSMNGEADMTYSTNKECNKVTKKGATRPDLILLNEQAKATCTSFKIRRDLPIKSHLG